MSLMQLLGDDQLLEMVLLPLKDSKVELIRDIHDALLKDDEAKLIFALLLLSKKVEKLETTQDSYNPFEGNQKRGSCG